MPTPLLLIAVIGILSLVRAAIAGGTGLVDDEAYYRLWSLAPALSYLDHPPMVAYFIAAGRWLMGDNPLGIRLGAGTAAIITLAAVWRTALLLFSAATAERTLWLMLAMPLLAVGGIIITPDVPSVLFTTLALWTLAELAHSANPNWWLATGLFCGLGLLSKYTNLFAGVTIVLWLIAVPENRKWFRSPQLWIGGLIAALLTAPVVMWNAGHGWASFGKQFGRVGRGNDFGLGYVAEMVGALFVLANPVIFVLAVIGSIEALRRVRNSRDSAATLLIASVVPMAGYFIVHALHDRVQGNWLGPVYPSLAMLAAIGLATIIDPGRQRRLFAAALATGAVMIAGIYLHTLSPIAGKALANDPTSQMRGWKDFAAAVEDARRKSGAAYIATSSFATTGQLAYAMKETGVPVIQINERLRYVHLPEPDAALLQKPALYVELQRRERPELVASLFRSVRPLQSLTRGPSQAPYASYATALLNDPVLPLPDR